MISADICKFVYVENNFVSLNGFPIAILLSIEGLGKFLIC